MRHVDKADIIQRIRRADMTDCSLYDLDDIQKASEDPGIAFDAARLHGDNEDSSDHSESPRPLAWRIDTSPDSPHLRLQVPSAGASDGAEPSHGYDENEFCLRSSDGAGGSSDRIYESIVQYVRDHSCVLDGGMEDSNTDDNSDTSDKELTRCCIDAQNALERALATHRELRRRNNRAF